MATWRTSDALNDDERLVIEYAEALTSTPVEVPADLAARLEARFSRRQRVELSQAIAWENARGRFNRGFGIESDDY